MPAEFPSFASRGRSGSGKQEDQDRPPGSSCSCRRRGVTSGQGGSPPLADREVAENWAMAVLEASLPGRPEATVPPR
ncbi:hypothetical protein PAL_GLEAN10019500 [Pteropus alecto]|uniref:Uncharacterized protein n=1 Tax=Pteropus alecto TaxID=9402 RepID=L5JQ35_PTEAL|nr:hypothetical protein PAL_GLEAN10019500 [Pteropus alecto]